LVVVRSTSIEAGGRAIVSLEVTNNAEVPIRLVEVSATYPLGARVGVSYHVPIIILDGGPPDPYEWPNFAETAAIDLELDQYNRSVSFDVCIRREPLIAFGGTVRIALAIQYETMAARSQRRSIVIVRKLPHAPI
jgi:hypothetical protein